MFRKEQLLLIAHPRIKTIFCPFNEWLMWRETQKTKAIFLSEKFLKNEENREKKVKTWKKLGKKVVGDEGKSVNWYIIAKQGLPPP